MHSLARNSTEEIKLLTGKTVHVPKCITSFKKWHGKPVPRYGNKALLTTGRRALFAELVVLELLNKEGWHGVWVDSYGRQYRVAMPHLKRSIASTRDLPGCKQCLLEKIREKAGCRGGCFDVFAWRGRKHRFIELKRHQKDRIRETQKRWLGAAMRCGIKMCDLLIVEWDIARIDPDS